MRGKILPALVGKWSVVLFEGDKLIGVCINIEMVDYLRMPSMPNNIEFFKKLGNVGSKL